MQAAVQNHLYSLLYIVTSAEPYSEFQTQVTPQWTKSTQIPLYKQRASGNIQKKKKNIIIMLLLIFYVSRHLMEYRNWKGSSYYRVRIPSSIDSTWFHSHYTIHLQQYIYPLQRDVITRTKECKELIWFKFGIEFHLSLVILASRLRIPLKHTIQVLRKCTRCKH